MEIIMVYLENRPGRNESSTKYNRKNKIRLDFAEHFWNGQFRIRNIIYREIVKIDYGDNKCLS